MHLALRLVACVAYSQQHPSPPQAFTPKIVSASTEMRCKLNGSAVTCGLGKLQYCLQKSRTKKIMVSEIILKIGVLNSIQVGFTIFFDLRTK